MVLLLLLLLVAPTYRQGPSSSSGGQNHQHSNSKWPPSPQWSSPLPTREHFLRAKPPFAPSCRTTFLPKWLFYYSRGLGRVQGSRVHGRTRSSGCLVAASSTMTRRTWTWTILEAAGKYLQGKYSAYILIVTLWASPGE